MDVCRKTVHFKSCLQTGLWMRWGLLTAGKRADFSPPFGLSGVCRAGQQSPPEGWWAGSWREAGHIKMPQQINAAKGSAVVLYAAQHKQIYQNWIHDKKIYSLERSGLSETDSWRYLQILHYLCIEYFWSQKVSRRWTNIHEINQSTKRHLHADEAQALHCYVVSSQKAWERGDKSEKTLWMISLLFDDASGIIIFSLLHYSEVQDVSVCECACILFVCSLDGLARPAEFLIIINPHYKSK